MFDKSSILNPWGTNSAVYCLSRLINTGWILVSSVLLDSEFLWAGTYL